MSRKKSFQTDLSQSLRPSYYVNSPIESYSYRNYDISFDKFSSQFQDKKAFDQTYYTTTRQDFSGIRKLPDSLSNIRETFSYIPSTSQKLYQQQDQRFKNQNHNNKLTDVFRQTMDLKSRKRKQSFNIQHSVSSARNMNQAYIKSDSQIISNRYGPNYKNKYTKFNRPYDVKSYGHIVNNVQENYHNSNLESELRRMKLQKQIKRIGNSIDEGEDIHINSASNISSESEKFTKKNYVEYYTPKIQKSYHNEQRFSVQQTLSPGYQRPKKDKSFDNDFQSPKKITDIKTLKNALDKKCSKNIKQRKSFNQKINLTDFIIGKNLGQGRFGTVHMAYHKSTGAIFAIKKIKKETIKSNKLIDQFILEVKLQTYLTHPFILKIYGIFDDQQYIYVVLQYLQQGTLYNYLKKYKKLPEQDTAEKIRYLGQSIKYLQDRGIAHRDIKPENIIMTNDVCKLADFGWATFCDEERRKTYCGTCDYVAPQILEGQQYDQTVDLWCIGVLTYELMAGKAPFYHMSRKETMKKIKNVNIQYPEYFSETIKSFIQGLIQKQPQSRMSIQQVLSHPFLKNIKLSE